MKHTPVLLDEVLEIFKPIKDGIFVDATLGAGGHSAAILATKSKVKSQKLKIQIKSQKLIHDTKLIGIDQDYDALTVANSNLKEYSESVILVYGNFRNIKAILKELKVNQVNGILVDLGMSSMQLDNPERGFSFKYDAPLDMRMNQNQKSKVKSQNDNSKFKNILKSRILNHKSDDDNQLTAELIIKTWNKSKIADILWQYGEERFARKIAKAIVQNRRDINSTKDLAEICEKCIPLRFRKYKIHPATKTFQALRIAVNDEIEALKDFLRDTPELLAPGGRLAIISFHSLEDRLVKQRYNELTSVQRSALSSSYQLITKHPIVATDDEIAQNPRSRSAKLRVIEKI